MTTSQDMDAIDMATQRHRPLEDTPESRAYLKMLCEVAAFQDTLVQANPTPEQVASVTDSVATMRAMLQTQVVAEHQRWYGRGEVGSQAQVLMPQLSIEHVDDTELRATTVVGEYFTGINGAVHGGVVSVLFDTAMGRLAKGTAERVCRTAYLTTQYRHITPVGQRLDLLATVTAAEGRKRFIAAELWHEDQLCAEADALFVEVRPGAQ